MTKIARLAMIAKSCFKTTVKVLRPIFALIVSFTMGVASVILVQKFMTPQAPGIDSVHASPRVLDYAASGADDSEDSDDSVSDSDGYAAIGQFLDSATDWTTELFSELRHDVSNGENSGDTAGQDSPEPFWQAALSLENPFNLNFFEIENIEPEAAPKITQETVDQILSDSENRIGPEFEIPEGIYNQTKFWFRIYTEFDSTKKVIHHSLHPHIVYDVIDITDTLALPARAKWLNTVKAEKLVAKRVQQIRLKLLKMSRKATKDYTDEEKQWWNSLADLKGNRKKILQTAAGNLRVQTGQKNFFENGLLISGRYLEGMEQIFESYNVPKEFTRLPFVESSFVIGATSKVGAAGIWQFMPTIGRKFMMVTDRIDERRNPWKATHAAAKLLKENYSILHKKWGLALTAYNHGPGGVKRAIKKTGSTDIAKIVKTYRSKSFDFASANFFTSFLAALHAQMYRDILWPNLETEPALQYGTVALGRSYSTKKLLQITKMEPDEILLYNPELDRVFQRKLTIPRRFQLYLPLEAQLHLHKRLAYIR